MSLTKVRYSMIANQYANVTDFGASPSASASVNDAAFTAALASATTVFVPEGTYEISSTITLNNKKIVGETAYTTKLKPTSSVSTAIILNSNSFLECIGLDGTNTTGATGVNAGSTVTFPMNMYDVLIEQFNGTGAIGLKVTDVVGGVFEFVRARYNETGLYVAGSSGNFPTYTVFNNCYFERASENGVKIARAAGFTFNNCLFEICDKEGFLIDPIDQVRRITLNNCWFERNYQTSSSNYQFVADGSGAGVTVEYIAIKDCFFYEANVAKTAKFDSVESITFSGNQIQDVAGTVLFDNSSTGTVTMQNRALTDAFNDVSDTMYFNDVIKKELSVLDSTATTVHTIIRPGIYEVTTYQANSGNPSNNTAFATVVYDGTGGRIDSNNGSLMTLTLSGSDIQVTQTTGATRTVDVKISQV
jgi:hypothetical protein